MLDFQQKKQVKKIMYSRVTMVMLFVACLALGRAVYGIYGREQLSAADYAQVERQYNDLTSEQDMLNSQIGKLNTESGVEDEIRNKFSVAKPGEVVVEMVDASSAPNVSTQDDGSLWSKFIRLF